MRGMLVDEGRSRITLKQFLDDQEPDVFLAVERLLQDVTSIAVSSQINDTTPKHC
jgi:hypothetical protein